MQRISSYTPLDVKRLETRLKDKITKKDDSDGLFITVFLVLATLSALILSIVLFILIKKHT